MLAWSLLLVALAAVGDAAPSGASRRHHNPHQPIVELDYASYQGVTTHAGISKWLGMRFAAAPTGERRFAAPADPPAVKGVQPANQVSGRGQSRAPIHRRTREPYARGGAGMR
jgi:hypothetical protein